MIPLLSICIPTRNRPQALQRTVNTIQQQVKAANVADMVEIVISDNTDADEMKIDGSAFKDGNIRYMSNAGNIGYARNVNRLIVEARGEYVWLLSDDDIVLDSAVISIVDCLHNQRSKTINYLTFYSGAIMNGVRDDNFYFKNCSQHYFARGRDFLEKYWLSVIFVSTNIFHREGMITHAQTHNLFDDINDVYQNSLLCLSFIDAIGHVRVIPKTLVLDSYNDKLYAPADSVKVPVLDYTKLFVQLKNLHGGRRYLANIKKDVDSSILSNGLRFAVVKQETHDDFDYSAEYQKVIKNTEFPLSSRAKAGFIWLLLKCPRRISRFIIRAIYRLKGKTHRYETIRKESLHWYEEIQKRKIKVSYG